MHQTFYVEVDEEISSVIGKLNGSLAADNYFVVTKRASISQSIVNLKLFKREADRLKKNIVIVSTDEQTLKIAERAGITTQTSMNGLEFSEDEKVKIKEAESPSQSGLAEQKRARLTRLGTSDYHNESQLGSEITSVAEESLNSLAAPKSDFRTKGGLGSAGSISNLNNFSKSAKATIGDQRRSVATDIARPTKEAASLSGNLNKISSGFEQNLDPRYGMNYGEFPQTPELGIRGGIGVSGKAIRQSNQSPGQSLEEFLDPEKEKKFEKIFNGSQAKSSMAANPAELSPENRDSNQRRKDEKGQGGSWGKFFLYLTFIFILVAALGGAYFFLPTAKINVYLENENEKDNLVLKASTNQNEVDSEGLVIPARLIEKEGEITLANETTGVSESSGQKARGKLTIYNEYSGSAQALIATTRFETSDGKIFRLVKGVSVPGSTQVSGETKPGSVEVEVVADMPGDDYNIEATSFTIPGFEGSERFEKIYAKSSESMTGGGLSADAVRIVNQSDLDSAKERTQAALIEKINDSIQSELTENEMTVVESFSLDVIDEAAFAKVGDLKNSFDYQIKGKAKVFVVSHSDIEKVAQAQYAKKNSKGYKYSFSKTDFILEDVEAKFDSGELDLKVLAQIGTKADFDQTKFKEKLVFKSEDQIKEVMQQYPQIRNLEVNVWPSFFPTTPRLVDRIKIEVSDFSE